MIPPQSIFGGAVSFSVEKIFYAVHKEICSLVHNAISGHFWNKRVQKLENDVWKFHTRLSEIRKSRLCFF